jgi:hypothetical protein
MACRTASLETTHDAVARDTGTVPIVNVTYFLDTFLPPLVEHRKEKLLEKLGEFINKEKRLIGFPKNPSKSKKNEAAAFRPMEAVFDKVVRLMKAADPEAEQTLKFSQARCYSHHWDDERLPT